MQKVISINLNGNAYQLDESGYDALREYLDRAAEQLKANPDAAEIMADLEQAIADKCQRYLGPHKTVVTAGEMAAIVAEMGPVDDAARETDRASAADQKRKTRDDAPPRRLYRIPDGAMIAGVCNGLAVHFKVDVTIVRIAVVIAALITKGAAIIAYIVMMFIIPEAKSDEARAATGAPLNARDIIERARKGYAEGSRQWRRQWRRQRRQWQRHTWPPGVPLTYGPPPAAMVLLPVFGLVHVALFLIMAASMISLVNTGAILNWRLPEDVPMWAGVLTLLVAYQIAVSPLRAAERWSSFPQPASQPAWLAFWNAVTWLVGLAVVVWIASNHTPEIKEFLRNLPELFRDFADAMRDLVER